MNCLRTAFVGDGKQLIGIQVSGGGITLAKTISLIGVTNVQRFRIALGIDGDGANTHAF